MVDRQQVCIYANREWLDFLGKPVQDVVGQHMSKVLGEAVYSRYRPLAERILAGEGLHVEGWVDYPSNGRRYLKEIFVPYGPDGGEVSTVAIYGRDETELRLREEELAARLHDLEASEALKSAIFDHARHRGVGSTTGGRSRNYRWIALPRLERPDTEGIH